MVIQMIYNKKNQKSLCFETISNLLGLLFLPIQGLEFLFSQYLIDLTSLRSKNN